MAEKKLEQIEMLRGFVSSYVVAGHALIGMIGAAGLLLRFGQEMVMCFFLISGFVIYYSTHVARDRSFKGYFIRRFRRIYPVLLWALAIACVVALLSGASPINWGDLLGNIFMLQDFRTGKPGVWVDAFGGNLPLWSLSYEWWFYMMFFPINMYVPGRLQLSLVAAVSFAGLATYIIHPNQISLFLLYFILWWTGLEFARTYCAGVVPTFFTQRYSFAVLGAFCVLVPGCMILLMPRPERWSYGLHPLLETRHFCACLILSGLAVLWSNAGWRYFRTIFGVFALVAPISYALYAFHYPLCVTSRNIDWVGLSPLVQWMALLLTIVLAYFVEVYLQKFVIRWTSRWLADKRPSF